MLKTDKKWKYWILREWFCCGQKWQLLLTPTFPQRNDWNPICKRCNVECDHLLIDAKNMLYRAIFTAVGDKKFKDSGHHSINIVLHFMKYYLDKFSPKNIHVFWDTRRSNTWRKEVMPSYKEGRSNTRDDIDVDSELVKLTESLTALLKNMCVRQYYRDKMEADDLIYAFCRMNPFDKIVIVSSDSDLKQISFSYTNVSIHHPLSKNKNLTEEVPNIDPVLVKALVGDKSDNIDGYYRIGPKTAKILIEDTSARNEFFQSEKSIVKSGDDKITVGNQRFKENLRIIDLSLCPFLLDNMMYTSSKQFRPIRFDLNKIREIISKYKLRGVMADISRYITPFKKLLEEPNGSID
jgi:DNA polymerase-1